MKTYSRFKRSNIYKDLIEMNKQRESARYGFRFTYKVSGDEEKEEKATSQNPTFPSPLQQPSIINC